MIVVAGGECPRREMQMDFLTVATLVNLSVSVATLIVLVVAWVKS